MNLDDKLPPWFEGQGLWNLDMVAGYINELQGFIRDLKKENDRLNEEKGNEINSGK